MKKLLVIISLTISFAACKIEGLTNDYDKLDKDSRNNIYELSSFENLKEKAIYKINGIQLKEELKKHAKSLVYVFTNGCTSDYCKPLMIYENYAKEKGYKLFLVMNGYRSLKATLDQPINSPLFSINNDFYEKKNRSTYITYFENDISDKPLNHKRKANQGSLFFYKQNKLDTVMRELPKN